MNQVTLLVKSVVSIAVVCCSLNASNCSIGDCGWDILSSQQTAKKEALTPSQIKAYSAKIAVLLNTYHYQQFFQSAAPLAFQFTENAWAGYLNAQTQSGNADWIQSEKINANAELRGDVVIVSSDLDSHNQQSWHVSVPLCITYDGPASDIQQPVSVDLLWKLSSYDNNRYLIDAYTLKLDGEPVFMEKKQPKAHCVSSQTA